jgi:Family of unknown function (DUF5719)
VSDQLPPGGGPGEERPPPLIPSRAARHQKKGNRLLRGRSAQPPPPPAPPRPEPPRAEPPPSTPSQRPPGRTGPEAPYPGPPGRTRPEAPPSWARPEAPVPPRSAAEGPDRRGPRVRPVPDRPADGRDRPDRGPDRGDVREPRRRPALKAPALKAPALKAPQLRPPKLDDLRGSTLGLAGALVAVVAVLVFAANALPAARPPVTPATGDPYSARWVCPLLPGQTTAVTVANVGSGTASLRTVVRENKKKSAPKTSELAGGKTEQLTLKPAEPAFVQVEAFSAPVVVSAPGLGCAAGPGNRWWLPASDTRFGTKTEVIIANPDSQPATVDLVPHLTSGSIRSDDREVFIPAGETLVRELGDDAPAGLKPSIEVVARAGRVVVGAAVSSSGTTPTLLPAQGAAKPVWSFAGGVSGGGNQAQVLVTNPNATPLEVDLQITTEKDTFRPEGEFGEPIANGGTAELAIPALDVKGPYAVQVRSVNGAPFVAALRVTRGDADGGSSRIDLGTGQQERGWLVPGEPAGDLVLANLSGGQLEARLGDLAGGGAGEPVAVPAGRIAVQKAPADVENLVVQAASAGLVVAPLNGGPIVPGSAIGGLPAGGPITPGPAAAP